MSTSFLHICEQRWSEVHFDQVILCEKIVQVANSLLRSAVLKVASVDWKQCFHWELFISFEHVQRGGRMEMNAPKNRSNIILLLFLIIRR